MRVGLSSDENTRIRLDESVPGPVCRRREQIYNFLIKKNSEEADEDVVAVEW